jgi:hypothetical protein
MSGSGIGSLNNPPRLPGVPHAGGQNQKARHRCRAFSLIGLVRDR